jgi:hypothetical protein
MGQTSLARAVIHHTKIVSKYGQYQHFVACDSATNKVELAVLVGAHLGLKPGKNITQTAINHFASSTPGLLILYNLETVWEPTQLRDEIEEFLSLLTDVNHLALVVGKCPFYHILCLPLIRLQCEEQKVQPKSGGV